MSSLIKQVEIPAVFRPLTKPARYRACHGGRGSGKSHFFAQQLVLECVSVPGTRAVCIREVQLTLRDSSKKLIEDKIQELGLGAQFKIMHDRIVTPGDGQITFIGMQTTTAESVKSLENIRIAWVEEAQTMSQHSLMLLRPTIRADGSELWFSWNARRKNDPVDMLLRGDDIPSNACVIQANWRDNPFFPAVLEQERKDCLRIEPEAYDHIWEGDYQRVLSGAYYAESINRARLDGRIGRVSADPLLPYQHFIDIGGTGARSDAFTLWVAQLVGREIRVLDYYEAVGQPLEAHLNWLRERSYHKGNSRIYLPHDGVQHDKVYNVSYESAFQSAGFDTTVVKNQGQGAAMLRVAAGRRMFPSMWFDQQRTDSGVDALSWYHEKQDVVRDVGLGPEHNWASHGADSFGMMAVVMEGEMQASQWTGDIDYSQMDRRIRHG